MTLTQAILAGLFAGVAILTLFGVGASVCELWKTYAKPPRNH